MGQSPTGFDQKTISRAGIIGAVLGVSGIALFLGIWFFTGTTDMQAFPRLVLAVCVPPMVIALMMGVYILFIRPSGTPPQS